MVKKKRKRKAEPLDFRDSTEVARASRLSSTIQDAKTIYSLAESGQVRQSMIFRGTESSVGSHWNRVWNFGKLTVVEFQVKMENFGFKVQVLKKPERINYEKSLSVPKSQSLDKSQLSQVVKILKLRKKGFTYAKVEEKLDMIGARALLIRAEKQGESVT